MRGCRIPLRRCTASGSGNTRAPRAARSRLPSARTQVGPERLRHPRQALLPGATTSRASRSASTTTAPRSASSRLTADLPEPMPPVSPIVFTRATVAGGESWRLRRGEAPGRFGLHARPTTARSSTRSLCAWVHRLMQPCAGVRTCRGPRSVPAGREPGRAPRRTTRSAGPGVRGRPGRCPSAGPERRRGARRAPSTSRTTRSAGQKKSHRQPTYRPRASCRTRCVSKPAQPRSHQSHARHRLQHGAARGVGQAEQTADALGTRSTGHLDLQLLERDVSGPEGAVDQDDGLEVRPSRQLLQHHVDRSLEPQRCRPREHHPLLHPQGPSPADPPNPAEPRAGGRGPRRARAGAARPAGPSPAGRPRYARRPPRQAGPSGASARPARGRGAALSPSRGAVVRAGAAPSPARPGHGARGRRARPHGTATTPTRHPPTGPRRVRALGGVRPRGRPGRGGPQGDDDCCWGARAVGTDPVWKGAAPVDSGRTRAPTAPGEVWQVRRPPGARDRTTRCGHSAARPPRPGCSRQVRPPLPDRRPSSAAGT